MTEQRLEQALQERARRECRDSTADYDRIFARAMARGQKAAAGRRASPIQKGALAALCAVALLMAVVWLGQPPRDARRGYLPTAKLSGAPASAPMETLSAQTPRICVQACAKDGLITLDAAWENATQEIWLVSWEPLFRYQWPEGTELRAPTEWLWLEPGTTCADVSTWQGEAAFSSAGYAFRGYRVSAAMLFWVDELLPPEDEDYPEQQSLLEDALSAGALLIAPGEWENGQAGEMRLVLPDSYLAAHPGQTPLAYALENGLLDGESDGVSYAEIE